MAGEDKVNQMAIDFVLGEDLYGVSVEDLQTRLKVLETEKTRLERELTKKQAELDAAHKIFGR